MLPAHMRFPICRRYVRTGSIEGMRLDEIAGLRLDARMTSSALRGRLGEPGIIVTVAGVGYRIDTQREAGREGEDGG